MGYKNTGVSTHYYKKNKAAASNEEKRKRLYRLFRLTATFVFIVALAYLLVKGYDFITTDEYFNVKNTRIIGNNFVSDNELISLMELHEGTNIFKIGIYKLQERMSSHPCIKGVLIKRELPNSLLINVEERMPIAVAVYKGRNYLIDSEGVVLGRREILLDDRYFPVIRGVDFKGIRFGEEQPPEALVEALRLLDAIKKKKELTLFENVSIDVEKERMALRLDDYEINMGRGDYEKKLHRFVEVRGDMIDRGTASKKIDMRFYNKVVIKN
jgi:cell division protein FtsQ